VTHQCLDEEGLLLFLSMLELPYLEVLNAFMIQAPTETFVWVYGTVSRSYCIVL
jgi:hypothetical protein